MPQLQHLITVGGEGPGFLLPIFVEHQGANSELIQRIDANNIVVDFEPITYDTSERIQPAVEFTKQVGESAIWSFRDPTGDVHIGSAQEIQNVGMSLLTKRQLTKFPMAAAEMAGFCNAETSHPDVMLAAFSRISLSSRIGAEIWRDSVLLLPRIKDDLSGQIPPGAELRSQLGSILAISKLETTHIYAPATIADHARRLPKWRALAEIFGIRFFEVHKIGAPTALKRDVVPLWSLFGMGGIARWVIKNAPFHGSLRHFGERPKVSGAIVHAAPLPIDVHPRGRLLIAIVNS